MMKVNKISSPIIKKINYNKNFSTELESTIDNSKEAEYLLDYPTIYVIDDIKNDKFEVYVGETTDIERRTQQHIAADVKRDNEPYWTKLLDSDTSSMYVIGHEYFNKSLTLDLENKLMLYLSSIDAVSSSGLLNKRTNAQNKYYTSKFVDDIFSKIWRKLHKTNNSLFPLEAIIKDSAIFKASPFHKLTDEQLDIKNQIMLKTISALTTNKTNNNNLILVSGEAGSGKTVLLSSLFYEIMQESTDPDSPIYSGTNNYLLVNHNQQLKVYTDIMNKLGFNNKKHEVVLKPTQFINRVKETDKADIVLIDEAHLLLTQKSQSYTSEIANQLRDIMNRAKLVIAIFDESQILNTQQYWDKTEIEQLKLDAKNDGNFFELENQLRINAEQTTINWLQNVIHKHKINTFKPDSKYDLQIFDSPEELEQKIKIKADDESKGLSRIIASFDWKYSSTQKKDGTYWNVKIGSWEKPWNLQLPVNKKYKDVAWAEQPQTINEVGSTFTVQGFDLNYAGVILGPSVKFRDGKIVFDKTASESKKAIQKRTLSDGTKRDFAEQLLQNELNVLLTRGVNGLYIYAVDDALREELKKAVENKLY